MENQSIILIFTAASIGFLHTLLGPDHYIPFIAMSKAGKWSKKKTLWITAVSGMGHVFSSVVLGLIGVIAGIALNKLDIIESFRADLAAWLIVSFGLLYFVWGIKKAYQHKHSHSHDISDKAESITPWIIFTIFVLGPCEPLIPLLIYPAVMENTLTLIAVIIIFTAVTSLTMIVLVSAGLYGFRLFHSHFFERYTHAIAGVMILFCGLSILLLGM
jgi:nickel/cobalt transporter (NicO) family protein